MRKSTAEIRAEQTRQLGNGMKRLVTGVRQLLERALEDEGVTLAQLRMLVALRDNAEMSAAELARVCYVTPQSMQSIVTKAEKAKWIVRTPSPTNRRILSAKITPAGQRVLGLGMALYEDVSTEIWGDVSVAELKAVTAALESAVERLQPRLDALHDGSGAKRKTVECRTL